jgi:hypothetical protein
MKIKVEKEVKNLLQLRFMLKKKRRVNVNVIIVYSQPTNKSRFTALKIISSTTNQMFWLEVEE